MIDFCFIGPPKTGTTWFYEQLYSSKKICLPKSPIKEIEFFDKNFKRGFEWYINQFDKTSPNQLLGECSPTYWKSNEASSNLYDLNPDILIFIGLRHPLSLFKSYYTHCLRKNYIGENYCQVDFFMNFYLNDLSYKKNYKKWSDKFKNIHYYDFDKIKSAPNYLIDQITLKIGDDIFVNKSNLNKTVNQGSLPKFKFVERSRVFVFNLLREYKFLLNVLIKLFRIIKPLLFSIRKMNKINLDEKVILLLSDEIIFYKKLLDDK